MIKTKGSASGTGIQKFEFEADTSTEWAFLQNFGEFLDARSSGFTIVPQPEIMVLNVGFPIIPEQLRRIAEASKQK